MWHTFRNLVRGSVIFMHYEYDIILWSLQPKNKNQKSTCLIFGIKAWYMPKYLRYEPMPLTTQQMAKESGGVLYQCPMLTTSIHYMGDQNEGNHGSWMPRVSGMWLNRRPEWPWTRRTTNWQGYSSFRPFPRMSSCRLRRRNQPKEV